MEFEVIRSDASRDLSDRLERAAGRLVSRAGEEWTLAIETGAPGLSLVACGPCRTKPGPDWAEEPEGSDRDRRRYRRTLASAAERSTETIEQVVRDLVWQPFEIAPHRLRREDPTLAGAFEATVLEALRFEPAEPLIIRFGVWNGDDAGPRYVCKVESLPASRFDAPSAWRWWSPLVATPSELGSLLEQALRARRPAAGGEASVRQDFWGWGAAGQAGACDRPL
jgi:hypothetical protein